MDKKYSEPSVEIYDDANYQDAWLEAEARFKISIEEYQKKFGRLPSLKDYTERLEKSAKEILDFIANDDVLLEEHLEIMCTQEHDGEYFIDFTPLSGIGDIFVLMAQNSSLDRC